MTSEVPSSPGCKKRLFVDVSVAHALSISIAL